MKKIIFLISISLFSFFKGAAQTDFPALKQKFLDYRKADQQDSALFIARKMNTLALKEQTDTSFWYALSMRYQGNPHDTWGNTDSTLFYWKKSMELFEKYHTESQDYLVGLRYLGDLNRRLDKIDEAKSYYIKVLAIDEKNKSVNDSEIIKITTALGNLYSDLDSFLLAEFYYKTSLTKKLNSFGQKSKEYAIGLNNLGYFQ